jgi:hypothetical protein
MKIDLKHGWVTLSEPVVDDLGKPRLDQSKMPMSTVRTMSLEQYEKYARDPEFVKAIPAQQHAEIMAARNAEVEAAVNAAIDAGAKA